MSILEIFMNLFNDMYENLSELPNNNIIIASQSSRKRLGGGDRRWEGVREGEREVATSWRGGSNIVAPGVTVPSPPTFLLPVLSTLFGLVVFLKECEVVCFYAGFGGEVHN